MLDNPVVLAFGAAWFFALALVLTQYGLRRIGPSQGALVSVPASAVLLWLIAPPVIDWRGWELQAALIFAAVGMLFPAAVTLLTFEANRRMGPNVAGALGNLTPLFAVLIAALFFGEVPTPGQEIGIAAIVAGIAALSIERRWRDRRWSFWVAAFPLAAAAIRGAIQPITKLGLALWSSPFAAVLIGYTVSSIVIAGASILRAGRWPSGFQRSGIGWFALVGVCNGCAVLALYTALAHGSVLLVSPLVATYPLLTLALTALLLRPARIDTRVVAGVAITVAGVIILIAGK